MNNFDCSYFFFLSNFIKIINLNINNFKWKELEELKIKNQNDKEQLKERLIKRNKKFLEEEKKNIEILKEEIFSDKNFIIQNLILEKDALKRKLEVNFYLHVYKFF